MAEQLRRLASMVHSADTHRDTGRTEKSAGDAAPRCVWGATPGEVVSRCGGVGQSGPDADDDGGLAEAGCGRTYTRKLPSTCSPRAPHKLCAGAAEQLSKSCPPRVSARIPTILAEFATSLADFGKLVVNIDQTSSNPAKVWQTLGQCLPNNWPTSARISRFLPMFGHVFANVWQRMPALRRHRPEFEMLTDGARSICSTISDKFSTTFGQLRGWPGSLGVALPDARRASY